jgi:hypothetical protein
VAAAFSLTASLVFTVPAFSTFHRTSQKQRRKLSEVLDVQSDVVLPRPTGTVVLITVPLVDFACRPVVQSPRLTLHFGVELRALWAKGRIRDEESAGGIEHDAKRIEQQPLLNLREMAEKEANQRRVAGSLVEFVFEKIALKEMTSINDPETVRFRSAFCQHLGRLIEQGDANLPRMNRTTSRTSNR